MIKRLSRLWSAVIAISLLAAAPAYGEIPKVDPFPGSGQTTEGSVTTGGPGEETTGGPGEEKQEKPDGAEEPGSSAEKVKQPEIQSEGAFLIDAKTGQVLYSKNGDKQFFPASITKLMTALLVAERSSLDQKVTFSAAATTNLESGAVTLGLVEGDTLTVRQSLYGLMLRSANEVANGLAEHVSGSVSAFADLMNARAKELGCTNTHFENPNGLNSSNHYTTPHDMALIARAAFQNDVVRTVTSALTYEIPATKKASARKVTMGHKMLFPGDSRYYSGVIGGKTGYTSKAGNTLVTCAERDGVRLIAVIMKSKSTHYADTKALFDYGFAVQKGAAPAVSAGWVQSGSDWYYTKEDGSRASNQWLKIDGVDYWFDSNGTMATGWRHFSNDAWYYFRSNGAMASDYWAQSNGNWYYLGADGAMMKNGQTPDGYRLSENGVWIP